MASALLAFAAEAGSTPAEGIEAWRELDAIADRIDARHRRRGGGDWMEDFNAVVFGELGYQREIDSDDTRFFRLPSVIAARRGSCLGLGALYLVLGERLGVGVDGILVPGHFFVRTRGSAPRNVELLRRGEAMPDDWYRGKYGPWPASAVEYMRPLSPSEVAAVGWFNLGNHARKAQDLQNAALAYARAAVRFPGLRRSASQPRRRSTPRGGSRRSGGRLSRSGPRPRRSARLGPQPRAAEARATTAKPMIDHRRSR